LEKIIMSKNNKKSFVLYADMAGVVQKLPDEKAGQLLKLILSHVNGEDYEVEDLMLDIAFEPIKAQLTRDAEKWENTCKARSEAGKKGGRPKKQVKAKKPIASFEKQSKAKKADNDNDNDNDNVTDTVNENDTVIKKPAYQLRAEGLFNRKESRPMDKAEKSAWESAKEIVRLTTEEEWECLEKFYAAPQSETYARKAYSTMLNNFTGEISRAKEWCATESKKYALPKPKHAIFK